MGYADTRRQIHNADTIPFNLASLSKPFTAIAVLQLVEQNKVKLNDPLMAYLPDFAYPAVTIRHLLTHTSGLPILERQEDAYISAHPDELITNQTAYKHLIEQKKPLLAQPGDTWRYNNVNYLLLSMLVETVSRQSFAGYMKQYVFKPAGMLTTYVREPGMPNTTRYTRPAMYFTRKLNVDSLDHKQFYTYYQLGSTTGSNNVISTIQDLWRFSQVLFSGKLIGNELMALAFAPVTLNNGKAYRQGSSSRSYGLGWTVYNSKPEPVNNFVFHDGHIPGLTTFLHHNLTKDQSIIFYDNMDNNPIQVMISVSNLLNGQPALAIEKRQSLVRVYGGALVAKGVDHAISTFNELKDDTTHYYLDELEMNRLGFDLMKAPMANHNELCLEVFKLNTLLNPKSGNTYDSYAMALAQANRKEEAIAMYRKSIALWPANEDGKKALQNLLER
ncbi:serine hydrolase (plasmid) [Spirosoma sp. KNUC1025]|nr:serine hydrolase [Spirosoma sp. KNUC1025]